MRITSITEPIREVSFLNAGKGQGSYYVDQLPVHVAEVDALPDGLDAIIATADLQGRERFEEARDGPPRLLGEVLPARLGDELLVELQVDPKRTAILLAGDFYTVPGLDQRGGSGDVTRVWRAFSEHFKWVAGVAGNHDMFGESVAPTNGLRHNAHYLDGESTTVDGLTVAGIGGIIGNPRKPHRKTDDEFVQLIEKLSPEEADVWVMHDGPDSPADRFRGSPRIRDAVEESNVPLVVRGHAHWARPLVELPNATQVLNVDCRVVVMRRSHS